MSHRCARCGSTTAPLVLAGICRPGNAYYVCLREVGPELVRHRELCVQCDGTNLCDIGGGLRAAVRAKAGLVPERDDTWGD